MLSRSVRRLAGLEVLKLIAAGLTNADVAGRLVVSPRTAEHHASAVLIKLRAPTRPGHDRATATAAPGTPWRRSASGTTSSSACKRGHIRRLVERRRPRQAPPHQSARRERHRPGSGQQPRRACARSLRSP
jgi:hypothetical protein